MPVWSHFITKLSTSWKKWVCFLISCVMYKAQTVHFSLTEGDQCMYNIIHTCIQLQRKRERKNLGRERRTCTCIIHCTHWKGRSIQFNVDNFPLAAWAGQCYPPYTQQRTYVHVLCSYYVCGSGFDTFSKCRLMVEVNFWVLGTRNLSWWDTVTSSPLPDPNRKMMTSGCFFLAVILRMEVRLCWCLTRPQPALSDSSLRTTTLSTVTTMWLERERERERKRETKEGEREKEGEGWKEGEVSHHATAGGRTTTHRSTTQHRPRV